MYCPLCGNKLDKIECELIDERPEAVQDDSVWLECKTKQCFGPTFPLVWHHPYKGTSSNPGDSWSLTWVE
jgi:hypothetical protein